MREDDKKDITDIVSMSIRTFFDENEARKEKPKPKNKWIELVKPLIEGSILLYIIYQLGLFASKY